MTHATTNDVLKLYHGREGQGDAKGVGHRVSQPLGELFLHGESASIEFSKGMAASTNLPLPAQRPPDLPGSARSPLHLTRGQLR